MCGKPMMGGGRVAESIVLWIFVLWRCFTCRCVKSCGLWQKVYLGPAQISSFSNRNFRRRNRHDLFWLVLSTGYFYILFLWAIVISDFLPLEINKYLVLLLSSITFTANSQADNHFYKYIYLFQKQSSRGVL